jgi:hypothetical protein
MDPWLQPMALNKPIINESTRAHISRYDLMTCRFKSTSKSGARAGASLHL